MDALTMTVCVIDNGSASQRKRTLDSLALQTCPDFETVTVDTTAFWTPQRIQAPGTGDLVLFLYAGSQLQKDAIQLLKKAVRAAPGPWYYFDERNFDAEVNGDLLGISDKPDFDPMGFVSHPYWSEGLLFPRDFLSTLAPRYTGTNFGTAMMELFLCAAAKQDGVHIRENLLIRQNRQPLSQDDRALLMPYLHAIVAQRKLPLTCLEQPETLGLYLFPKKRQSAPISFLVYAEEGEDTPDLSIFGDHQVIYLTKEGSFREICTRGASLARHELLCFIDASCGLPAKEELERMADFAALPGSGFVCPSLYKDQTYLYAGVSSLAGQILQIPKEGIAMQLLWRDILGVRETGVPAWQFWMVKKDLLLQAEDQVQKLSDTQPHSREYEMLEYAFQLKELGRQNLYIGDVSVPVSGFDLRSDSQDFCSKLFRWKGRDAFCPPQIRAWSYRYSPMRILSYFPEPAPAFDPLRKRLFILTHELSLTGAPIVLSHGVRILQEEGWQIVVASPEDGVLKRTFLDMGIPVLVMEDLEHNDQWLHMVRDFDLILVNTIVPYPQIEQLRDFPVPVMWWLHDARSGYEKDLHKVLPDTIGSNIHTYAVSRYAESAVNDYRPKYPTKLLLYGLKDEAQRVLQNPKPIENAQGRQVFISIGTILPRKGQDILVQAVRLLPEEVRSGCLFLFIGKPVNKEMYKQIKDLEQEFPGNVRHIKAVPHEEVFNLYSQAAAVICSSRDDPLPTFMAETMMVNGVCICSENTGTAPAITDGVNGFIYHNDDPAQLADCITRVSRMEDTRQIRKNARVLFEEVFSLEVFRKNLLRCVMECMENGQGDVNHDQ